MRTTSPLRLSMVAWAGTMMAGSIAAGILLALGPQWRRLVTLATSSACQWYVRRGPARPPSPATNALYCVIS